MDELMSFKDENGNELQLNLIDSFEFQETQYALFATPIEQLGEDEEPSIYVMKPIFENGEINDFQMPTEDELEAVTPYIIQRLESRHSCSGSCSSCGGCHHDEESEHDDCDCGCGCH